jgi:hypothetical protein
MTEQFHGDMTGMQPLVVKPYSLRRDDVELMEHTSAALLVGESTGVAAIAECKRCKQLSHQQKKIPIEAGQKLQIDLFEILIFSQIILSVLDFHHVDGSGCPRSHDGTARSARHHGDVSLFAIFGCASLN